MFAALYGLPTVVLRVFMTYGPGQYASKLIPSTVAPRRAAAALKRAQQG